MLNAQGREAVATGNNAAWLCICGRALPLLGHSGSIKGVSEGTRIDCPDCHRGYFVVPEGKDLGAVKEVREVQ
jgi:hypothetical protein